MAEEEYMIEQDEVTSLNDDDIFLVTKDPEGTPESKIISWGNLKKLVPPDFPSTVKTFEETVSVDTPNSGEWVLYFKEDGLYQKDDSGNEFLIAAGELKISGDELTLKQRRDNSRTLSEGFDGSTLPAGFSWQGSPFVTPTVDLSDTPSYLSLLSAGAERAFLATSTIPSTSVLPIIVLGWVLGSAGSYAGWRLDDGTDNNYFEWVLSGDLKGTVRTRVGGGAVATVSGSAMPLGEMFGLRMNRTGTKYSSWGANLYMMKPNQGALIQTLQATSATTNASWTPSRFGIVFDTAGINVVSIDALYDLA